VARVRRCCGYVNRRDPCHARSARAFARLDKHFLPLYHVVNQIKMHLRQMHEPSTEGDSPSTLYQPVWQASLYCTLFSEEGSNKQPRCPHWGRRPATVQWAGDGFLLGSFLSNAVAERSVYVHPSSKPPNPATSQTAVVATAQPIARIFHLSVRQATFALETGRIDHGATGRPSAATCARSRTTSTSARAARAVNQGDKVRG
jgi:hypothetical protein